MNVHRIAAFFAPPRDHPLWRAGSQWLGRDAGTGSGPARLPDVPDPVIEQALRQAPARYGFHATLKPPFRFAPGFDAQRVCDLCREMADKLPPFRMPVLSVQWLDQFLALRPEHPDDPQLKPLEALAARLVRDLDVGRLAATEAEIAMRRRPDMSPLEVSMLNTWGYPYVLDTWRFHMTLSARLSGQHELAACRDRLFNMAGDFFEPALREPLWCTDVCLFIEPAPGKAFQLWRRVPLAG